MQEYSVVIVVHISDLGQLKQYLPIIHQFLTPKNIIIISNKKARQQVKKMGLGYIKFVDEDKIAPGLTYNAVKEIMIKRGLYEKRCGWYFQQFLKMAYATVCEEKWYLLWDADTIPLKKIEFFDSNGRGILDIKSEWHKPYFRTIKKLIGIEKKIKGSFIAEHMLINKEVMLDLLSQIESNKDIKGLTFFQKISNSINVHDLKESGFSEYETYGSFVMEKYPHLYVKRKLKTLREGKIILGDNISYKTLKWAGLSYDIVSFEKYHRTDFVAQIFTRSFLRYFISMEMLWNIYKRVHRGKYYE